jgi:hypothetical protein
VSYTFTLATAPIPNPEYFEADADNGTFLFLAPNGAIYFVCLAEVGAAEDTGNLEIWKSTDWASGAAATFTRLVDDHTRSTPGPMAACIAGTVLYLALYNTAFAPGTNLEIHRFDTTTDAFLTNDYGGPKVICNTVVAWQDGSLLALGDGTGVFSASCDGVPWTGLGSWGSPFTIIGSTSGEVTTLWGLRETTRDRAHAFYADARLGSHGLYHISIDKPNTLGSLQLLTSGAFRTDQLMQVGSPANFDAQSQMVIPYLNPNDSLLHIQRGTLADNPVWTDEVIDTSSLAGLNLQTNNAVPVTGEYFTCAAVQQGATLFVIFSAYSGSGEFTWQSYLYETHTTSSSGGWSAPMLIWTTPSRLGTASGIASPFVTAFSNSQFGIMDASFNYALALAGTPPPGITTPPSTKYQSLQMQFILATGATTSDSSFNVLAQSIFTATALTARKLNVVCNAPPPGVVGQPYSSQVGYEGGTPPYTVTLAFGSLPTGLSVSTSGLISGTPSAAGTYVYTLNVSDSGGQSYAISCWIVIKAPIPQSGGSGVCIQQGGKG